MITMAMIALLGMLALFFMAKSWLVFLPVAVAKAATGLFALYWVNRLWFVHERTHDLPAEARQGRSNAMYLAVSIVLGFSLVGA